MMFLGIRSSAKPLSPPCVPVIMPQGMVDGEAGFLLLRDQNIKQSKSVINALMSIYPVRLYNPWGQWLYVFHVSYWYLILDTWWSHIIVYFWMNEWVSSWMNANWEGAQMETSVSRPLMYLTVHQRALGPASLSCLVNTGVMEKSRFCCLK